MSEEIASAIGPRAESTRATVVDAIAGPGLLTGSTPRSRAGVWITNNMSDWRVVIDDTGGPFTGWPSVCSDLEDRCVLHRAAFIQEFWNGPSLSEALEIARIIAKHMNER